MVFNQKGNKPFYEKGKGNKFLYSNDNQKKTYKFYGKKGHGLQYIQYNSFTQGYSMNKNKK